MPQPSQLPGAASSTWEWQLHGSCRGVDSAVFFHPDGERGRSRSRREEKAKSICRQCPVLEQCRAHALEVAEPYGIWGGLSEAEREMILRPRRRNRHRRRLATASSSRTASVAS